MHRPDALIAFSAAWDARIRDQLDVQRPYPLFGSGRLRHVGCERHKERLDSPESSRQPCSSGGRRYSTRITLDQSGLLPRGSSALGAAPLIEIAKEWNAESSVHDALMQNMTGTYDTGVIQAPAWCSHYWPFHQAISLSGTRKGAAHESPRILTLVHMFSYRQPLQL